MVYRIILRFDEETETVSFLCPLCHATYRFPQPVRLKDERLTIAPETVVAMHFDADPECPNAPILPSIKLTGRCFQVRLTFNG